MTGRRYFGLQDGSGTAYAQVPYGSLRLWDSHTSWRDVETAPGVYDWAHLDEMVDAACSHDVEVTLVLGGYTPACYGAQNSVPPLDTYTRYVRAVMSRYRGRIASYACWNEANSPYFFSGTQEDLLALARVTWEVRNQVDPSARLLSPSWASRLRYEQRQLTGFMAMEAWRYFEVLGVSLYPLADQEPEDAMVLATTVRNAAVAGGMPATYPLWATEINYGVGPNPATLSTYNLQVARVLRTYLMGACSGIERIYWYRWDWGLVNGQPLANTYLTDPYDHDRPTPAGLALRTVMRWMEGGRPRLRVLADGTHRVRVATPTVTRLIYWHPTKTLRVQTPNGPIRVTLRPKVVEVSG